MAGSNECIIIFTKFPVPGKVKTRLVPPLTKAEACKLYKSLVESTLKKAEKTGKRIIVCYYPAGSRAGFIRWLGKGVRYIPQKGAGLGSKMKNAFICAFGSGYDKVLLAGCDIPDLSAGQLKKDFKRLSGCDALLGPAKDGGYYMIGFNKKSFLPEVFSGIKWSTPSVLTRTLAILKKNNYRVSFSRELSDIDTAADILLRQAQKRKSYA